MRSISKAIMIGLAVAAAAGCGSSKDVGSSTPGSQVDSHVGQVGLNLNIAPGIDILSVHAVVTQGAVVIQTKDIPVNNSSKIAAVIGSIPFGTGYTLTLTATPVGDAATGITCLGTKNFDVLASATPDGGYAVVEIDIALLCKTPVSNGSIFVNGVLDVCPQIDNFEVLPASVNLGSSMSAAVHVLTSGALAKYSWSETGAAVAIGTATAANTSVTCAGPGLGSLIVTVGSVSDPACVQTAIAPIECTTQEVCGNGNCVASAAETAYTCPVDCGDPACGDGKCPAGGYKVAACEAGDTSCSTPAGHLACAADCGQPTCGDGVCNAPYEVAACNPADSSCTIPAGKLGCAADCGTQALPATTSAHVVADLGAKGAACMTWMQTNCIDAQAAFGCDGSATDPGTFLNTDTAKKTACLATLDCLLTKAAQPQAGGSVTYCGSTGTGVSACYCGSAADCLATGQNGVCKSLEESGLGSTSPSTIAASFTDATLAAGAANGLIACVNAAAAGKAACGL